ncbi:glycoside hydrolase [Microthyrium microscopicum]|uniref:Alpha-galactosidase n=1 Tax=Microthyrium microscopicum TaxID=703497 RepID=A0A6A6TV34_9PEZI|nr:glycoside hydrolase [Microthyrium microscopicum]
MLTIFAFFLASLSPVLSVAAKGGVGRLPALGFNSWNAFHCDIDESKFLTAAQKIVDLGLKDAGYEYVNIDDCWSMKDQRDPKTHAMLPNMTKFPDGIDGLAKKIHDMGLKIGIYSSAGTKTCEQYPASINYEDVDAKSFSDWGIDYLKYDNCFVPDNMKDDCQFCMTPNTTCQDTAQDKYCPAGYDYSKSKTAQRYNAMRDALNKQTRPILYSLCEWGTAGVHFWGNTTAQSWRTTGDISPNFTAILTIANLNTFTLDSVDFGGHSDPDMLEIGNAPLTNVQERTHFALWAVMKSPLLIGTDLDKIKPSSVAILKNKNLLAFNQDDVYGKPAFPFKWGSAPDWTYVPNKPAEYWAGQYKEGIMILLFNNHDTAKDYTFAFREVPGVKLGQKYHVVDGWTDNDLGCFTATGSVVIPKIAASDTVVLILKDGASCLKKLKVRGARERNVIIPL